MVHEFGVVECGTLDRERVCLMIARISAEADGGAASLLRLANRRAWKWSIDNGRLHIMY